MVKSSDGRYGHPIQDAVVSIIVIAMVTMLILPGSPATDVLKTVGDFMAGAIKDVTGRTA